MELMGASLMFNSSESPTRSLFLSGEGPPDCGLTFEGLLSSYVASACATGNISLVSDAR